MYSLVNLDQYRTDKKQWGGYVFECAKQGAIYTGISNDLDTRMKQHTHPWTRSARFIQQYGPPIRILELYFCDTEEQARQWEMDTSNQLYGQYKDRPVYYVGRRSVIPPKPQGDKRMLPKGNTASRQSSMQVVRASLALREQMRKYRHNNG